MNRAMSMVQETDRRAEAGIEEKDLALCKKILRRAHKNLSF
jgi:hypothetical protein